MRVWNDCVHSLGLSQGAVKARQLQPPLPVLVTVLLLFPSALALCVGRVCVYVRARVRVCVHAC